VNSLPETVTRQRHGCDLNADPTAPESSTLNTRLQCHWNITKKLSYRPGTARCIVLVEICQLPRNSAETTCTTSPKQIEVMK